MKKTILPILLLSTALLSSCTEEAGEATIKVGHRYVESGSIYDATRAVINAEITGALSALLPSSVRLTLAGDGGTYTTNTGEDVTLPFGRYSVTGESSQTKTFVGGEFAWVSREPLVQIDDEIEVIYGKNYYTVAATIESSVLIFDATTVASVTYSSTSGLSGTLPTVRDGDLLLSCVSGTLTGTQLSVRIIPKEGQPWSAKAFTLKTGGDADGLLVERGKWYKLSPTAITTQSGAIELNVAVWAEGGDY